ncbi:MAG: Glutamine cyclotransferase [Thermodesulfobacteriota bacterium]|nr:Glutamine cyclotransferase [Thermodesulfobacteriota bacterium]
MRSNDLVRMVAFLLALILTAALPVCAESGKPSGLLPVYGYRIVQVYPHDRGAYTQGLAFSGGHLYEGTGQEGRSSLRRVELKTGRILQEYRLDNRYFGEGITVFKEQIIQLTWRNRVGFVYDRAGFRRLNTFPYDHEGWGITHDGRRLIVSDGSATLRFLDPRTLREVDRLQVRDEDGSVTGLNELEYVRGTIYANVWPTDRIAMINPRTGSVTGWVEMTGLLVAFDARSGVDVLNGIAYDPAGDRLFVTGKLWPHLFEIKLVRK